MNLNSEIVAANDIPPLQGRVTPLTYAIGDIHGMYDTFMRALEWIDKDADNHPRQIVCLGDYVDRGPDSRKVLDFIALNHDREEFTFLRGNHDQMMMEACDRRENNGWLSHPHYGGTTLPGYRRPDADNAAGGIYDRDAITKHCQLIQKLPTLHSDRWRYFVHAGLDPSQEPHNASLTTRIWIRPDAGEVHEHDFGKLVVHGHTPQPLAPRVMPFRLNLDTGACFGRDWQVIGENYGDYGRLSVARWDTQQKLSIHAFLVDGTEMYEYNLKFPKSDYYGPNLKGYVPNDSNRIN